MPARAFCLLLALLPPGCRQPRPSDPVILSLADQSVRASDFARHLARLDAEGLDTRKAPVRATLLQSFLEERVLVLEARRRGLIGAGAPAEQEQAAVARLLAAALQAELQVSDAEIRGYFASHQEALAQPESVVLRQILVPTENEARDIRRRLQKEPKAFLVLAQTRSHAPEASAGGLMGRFARGQLPAELEAVAFALGSGDTSEVVHSPLGYHVLRVDERHPARARDLAECREEIRVLLLQRKTEHAARRYVRGLLARAKVNHEAAQAASAVS